MALDDIQRLQEMGISIWQLRRPDLFPEHSEVPVTLPDSCKLLLVCDSPLDDNDAWLFGKILSSMKLTPDQALQLPHEALVQIGAHSLKWCWYIGEPASGLDGILSLFSAPLSRLQQDPAAKKQLWQQICSYDT